MLFNSYQFLFLFLPIALAGYFLLASWQIRAGAAWLVAASLFFYGWWDIRFLALLVPAILANYLTGRALGKFAAHGRHQPKRWPLAAAIAGNLLVLGYFKYGNFFVSSVNGVLNADLSPLFNIATRHLLLHLHPNRFSSGHRARSGAAVRLYPLQPVCNLFSAFDRWADLASP